MNQTITTPFGLIVRDDAVTFAGSTSAAAPT